MKTIAHRSAARLLCGVTAAALTAGVPLALTGCDEQASQKTTTTTKTETPSGTTKTTETHEKKVETNNH